MTTTKERLEAINNLASTMGKPRSAVLAAVAPTWNLSLWERAKLAQEIATTPEPPTAAERQEAEQHAAKVRDRFAQQRVDQGASDLAAWRAYQDAKETNPFAAAQLMNRDPHAISRGRALDTTPTDGEPPPKNAA